jgi:hypothetical protein
VQFLNYWSAGVNVGIGPAGTVDDRLTRGGPAAYRPGYASLSTNVSSDPRKSVVAYFGTFNQTGPGDGRNTAIFGELQMNPRPHIEFSFGPSISWDKAEAQFLGRIVDPLAVQTFGTRYIFANVDQTTLALDTRLNYTFSPRLTLQVFAQPFIATGDYGAVKEFAQPGKFDFLVYGRDVGEIANGRVYPSGQGSGVSFAVPKPDFNIASLRGNAVLRWEWRPGSTMYFAWQQTRSDFRPVGDFEFGRGVDTLFGAAPDNIFLLKVSYWIN